LIDAVNLKPITVIPVEGKNPEHAVMSPNHEWIYVSAEDSDKVDVIDVRLQKQIAQIQVGKRPRGIGFTPDSELAIVACEIESKVYVIDVATRTVKASVNAGMRSNGVLVHPSGKLAISPMGLMEL
jgi:YVTN family beta-propeller protein